MTIGTLNGNKVDILLVEDNPDDVILTLDGFRKAHLINKVQVFTDGQKLLDYVWASDPSHARQLGKELILLDLNLPNIHGLDVLRKLKADERSKNLPVIILTASQEERGVMQSYKLGAQGCIVKPFDFHKFVEAVNELRLGWALLTNPES